TRLVSDWSSDVCSSDLPLDTSRTLLVSSRDTSRATSKSAPAQTNSRQIQWQTTVDSNLDLAAPCRSAPPGSAEGGYCARPLPASSSARPPAAARARGDSPRG